MITSWRSFFPLLLLVIALHGVRADERIWVDVQINGKPARLIFDTGASDLILFTKGAERLGLKVTLVKMNLNASETSGGVTDECELTVGNASATGRFTVVDIPNYAKFGGDGVIGWGALRKNILKIDVVSNKLTVMDSLPKETEDWLRIPLKEDSRVLCLDMPGHDGSSEVVLVDTGDRAGVSLRTATWKAWREAHQGAPATLVAYFMLNAGVVVREEVWAKSLNLGPLTITDVPVREANVVETSTSTDFGAVLGLAALKRLDFIVDGPGGTACIRAKNTRPDPYNHNRTGAVFVPGENDALIAHVLAGSPADAAGIRDGDILLEIGDLDVTKWRSDPTVLPLSRFLEQSAGTKLALTLKRGGKTYKADVVLSDLLPPESTAVTGGK